MQSMCDDPCDTVQDAITQGYVVVQWSENYPSMESDQLVPHNAPRPPSPKVATAYIPPSRSTVPNNPQDSMATPRSDGRLFALARLLAKAKPGQGILKVGSAFLMARDISQLLEPDAILTHHVISVWAETLMRVHPNGSAWVVNAAHHQHVMNRESRSLTDSWGKVGAGPLYPARTDSHHAGLRCGNTQQNHHSGH